ncbi:hypothetical protein LINPERPRIM_LOCUS41095, partial [Linum perenne]
EGALEGSYCVWAPKSILESSVVGVSPSPGRCAKSNSTGSSLKQWGGDCEISLSRSSSDDKAASYMFMNPKFDSNIGTTSSSGNSNEVKVREIREIFD